MDTNTGSGSSDDYLPMDPKRLLERLHTALNTRDLENLVRCFQVDYESEEPAHPGREIMGLEQLSAAWEQVFNAAPGFRADLIHYAVEAETIWAEWHWHTDNPAAGGLNRLGVIVYGVEGGLIAWSRIYMEDVQPAQAEEK